MGIWLQNAECVPASPMGNWLQYAAYVAHISCGLLATKYRICCVLTLWVTGYKKKTTTKNKTKKKTDPPPPHTHTLQKTKKKKKKKKKTIYRPFPLPNMFPAFSSSDWLQNSEYVARFPCGLFAT